MKINWTCLSNYVGVGFGYSNHQKMLLQALLRQGVEVDQNAEVAVHLTTCDTYKPIPGAYNVLYSMYECTDLPKTWIPELEKADLIVVPCNQNKWLFKRYTNKPVEVCWEGVNENVFVYKKRTFPEPINDKNPFVFLWVGATNPRKGTEHLIVAWEVWNRRYPELRDKTLLIMKTTQSTDVECNVKLQAKYKDGEVFYDEIAKEKLPAERIMGVAGNAIVDTRRLPVTNDNDVKNPLRPDSLVDLYHFAHAFVFPTRGEGFGLTLAEAAATGLPCIYTPYGGPVDFMNEKIGYPLKYRFAPVKTVGYRANGEKYTSHETRAASANTDHIIRRMKQVYSDYGAALEKGRLAAEHIRRGFTWDISAQSLIKILNKYYFKRRQAA